MAKRRLYDSNSEQEPSTVKSSEIEGFDGSEMESLSDLDDLVDNAEMDEFDMERIEEEEAPVDGPKRAVYSAPLSSAVFRKELCGLLVDFLVKNEKYAKRIREVCAENGESISIDYSDVLLCTDAIEKETGLFLDVLSDATTEATRVFFPSYHLIRKRVVGRITNLPVSESLRSLRSSHLGKLVRVAGVVTRRTGVLSEYSLIRYNCTRCKATFGPFAAHGPKPTTCFECQAGGPFVVNTLETLYKDFQRIILQEIPGLVPAGSLPRSREVILSGDLVDCCRPGDEVDVVGLYKNGYSAALNSQNGFPVFSTVIEASSVARNAAAAFSLTSDDIREIRALSKHPSIVDILIDSVAPSIYGHRQIKTALLLAMAGGVSKERNGSRVRGDINVLLMGDPGTAKSQFLRFVHSASHRAVLATGQGSSSIGLTASVRRDPALAEWVLEGGALVLADGGVCLIDEFDKMGETDRVAIHEAMEQQSISISKAGIVASLHARCAVIAAANPIRGRYNPALSFSQNINLSDPIVSRFDLLCVIKDSVDTVEDTRMGRFILANHGCDAEQPRPAPAVSMALLKKYLLYAHSEIHPTISSLDSKKISLLYSDLRKECHSSGIPITVRHIESIIRISEAFAKLRLSQLVSKADIDMAISVTLSSFLSAQKFSISKRLKNKFAKYFDENSNDLALYILKQLATETFSAFAADHFSKSDFLGRCKQSGLALSEKFFSSQAFLSAGFVLNGETIGRTSTVN